HRRSAICRSQQLPHVVEEADGQSAMLLLINCGGLVAMVVALVVVLVVVVALVVGHRRLP
ncbi:MAG: hypothetical protein OEW24_05725, partial [Chloroflexota bacterium]|nr:hypothetical protein [Chloroflexota bacterium]